MTGKTKQRMVMNGPASVLLTVTKEDIGVTETKNIVFHPHGVQVWMIALLGCFRRYFSFSCLSTHGIIQYSDKFQLTLFLCRSALTLSNPRPSCLPTCTSGTTGWTRMETRKLFTWAGYRTELSPVDWKNRFQKALQ